MFPSFPASFLSLPLAGSGSGDRDPPPVPSCVEVREVTDLVELVEEPSAEVGVRNLSGFSEEPGNSIRGFAISNFLSEFHLRRAGKNW